MEGKGTEELYIDVRMLRMYMEFLFSSLPFSVFSFLGLSLLDAVST